MADRVAADEKKLRRNTYRSYESHIRLYLVPYLGTVRLDRLQVDARHDRLYPLFHLIAYRGLRRGEACGQRWTDTLLEAGTIEVLNQIVQYGWQTGQDSPKTDASAATVALDAESVAVLTEHRARQRAERLAAGQAWVESGLVFTQLDGSPLHPADVTDQPERVTVM
jgi:integrase